MLKNLSCYIFRYVMYMAESIVDPTIKYVYQGDFGETVEAAVRPIVIYYEVKQTWLQFKRSSWRVYMACKPELLISQSSTWCLWSLEQAIILKKL